MNIRGFLKVSILFVFAAANGGADTPFSEADIWRAAVAFRAESFTLAPGELPYEQYQLDDDGAVKRRETGVMSLAYDQNGKAVISIVWAKRGEEDFTEERAKRLEKQASRRNEFLSFTTPFDPDVQDKLERKAGARVFADGKTLWQYEFSLPMNGERSLVGTARVGEDGRPHDFRYTLSPLPWFLDIIDMHIVFDGKTEQLVFGSLNYRYEASFLFWAWRGGGKAAFDGWRRIASPPRIQ